MILLSLISETKNSANLFKSGILSVRAHRLTPDYGIIFTEKRVYIGITYPAADLKSFYTGAVRSKRCSGWI